MTTVPCLVLCVVGNFGSLSRISGCQLSLMVFSSLFMRFSKMSLMGHFLCEEEFVVTNVSCSKGDSCLCFLCGCSKVGEMVCCAVANDSSCCG